MRIKLFDFSSFKFVSLLRSVKIQIAKMDETPEGSDAAENPIRLHSVYFSIKPNLVEASP
ncbi:hypothetical protein B5C00_04945 [Staphylococcus delphini]|uniref:Uncharacterized protein n=1 Tax=Staphylococcus delphini TaxID=53344 RepID=A0AAX0QXP0_9STAP|nr:hypothetical protein B5C00_04945 [Staphylococcus delphini]PCF52157.1 hypothetical protein B5C07_01575 [Staphylococcus delphini]PNZ96351.1 hypothetical protein CD148_00740 [Staphylococcus delphini]RIZ54891.1 hypothetical protein CDL68_04045 [Staphylococcus delphini]